MDTEKLNELMKDESFVKELISQENPEDVQKLLEEKGVEISIAEIRQIGDLLQKISNGEISNEQLENAANGELSEDELEEVAGGFGPLLFALGLCVAGIVSMGGMAVHEATRRRW